jgi:hypothetical protein
MVIREVGVGSAAKVFGTLYAVFGLILGGLVALFSLVGSGMAGSGGDAMPGWFGGLFGVAAVIFFPLMYGVLGAIGAALSALFYNIIAGMVGGLQIETEGH